MVLTTSFDLGVKAEWEEQRDILDGMLDSAREGDGSGVYTENIKIVLTNGTETTWRAQDIDENGNIKLTAIGNAGIDNTFTGANNYGQVQMCQSVPSSSISWKDTYLRTFLNNEYYNKLPDWIKDKIIIKTIKYQIGNWNQLTNYDEVSDPIMIKTVADIIGKPTGSAVWKAFEEDKQDGVYDYYNSLPTPRPAGIIDDNRNAWTAVPYTSSSQFIYIDQGVSPVSVTNYKYVRPCIWVGQ